MCSFHAFFPSATLNLLEEPRCLDEVAQSCCRMVWWATTGLVYDGEQRGESMVGFGASGPERPRKDIINWDLEGTYVFYQIY